MFILTRWVTFWWYLELLGMILQTMLRKCQYAEKTNLTC